MTNCIFSFTAAARRAEGPEADRMLVATLIAKPKKATPTTSKRMVTPTSCIVTGVMSP